jgi:hypothetical protein
MSPLSSILPFIHTVHTVHTVHSNSIHHIHRSCISVGQWILAHNSSTHRPITSSCWVELLNQAMIFIQYSLRIVLDSRRPIFLTLIVIFTVSANPGHSHVMTSKLPTNQRMDILVRKKFAAVGIPFAGHCTYFNRKTKTKYLSNWGCGNPQYMSDVDQNPKIHTVKNNHYFDTVSPKTFFLFFRKPLRVFRTLWETFMGWVF